jgi:hypothetical protein
MNPLAVTALIPVVRELWELGEWMADRIRARRARRRAAEAERARQEANERVLEALRAHRARQ